MSRALSRKKSESKNIQRDHIRMLRTREGLKPVRINVGVKKIVPAKHQRISLVQPKPRSVVVKPRPYRVLKIKPVKKPKSKSERISLSYEDFKDRLFESKEFQNLFGWLNKNLEELYYGLFQAWMDWSADNDVTEENLKKRIDEFVFDEIDYIDNFYGMDDKARVSFHGDFSKLKNKKLRQIIWDSMPQQEYGYFYDPWDQQLIVDDPQTGIGDGVNEDYWYPAMIINEPVFIEDLDRGDSLMVEPGTFSNTPAAQFLDLLEKNNVPYVFISGVNDAGIVVPKEFKDEARRLRQKIRKS